MFKNKNSIYPNPNDRNYYDEYTPGDYDEFLQPMPESYVNEELGAIPFAADDGFGISSSDESFQSLPYNPSEFTNGTGKSYGSRRKRDK